MIGVEWDITLRGPLLMGGGQSDPNGEASLPFIPGAAWRGIAIQTFLCGSPGADIPGDSMARRLFFDGEVQWLNGYPLIRSNEPNGESKRALPAPSTLSPKEKGGDGLLINRQLGSDNDEQIEGRLRDGTFIVPLPDGANNTMLIYNPELELAMHTARDRHKGRATEGSGALFHYEALTANQSFRTVAVVGEDEDMAERVAALIPAGDYALGKSRGAEYGHVTVSEGRIVECWTETGTPDTTGETFTLTLLSDLIVRNKYGGYATRLDSEALSDIGITASIEAVRWTPLSRQQNCCE